VVQIARPFDTSLSKAATTEIHRSRHWDRTNGLLPASRVSAPLALQARLLVRDPDVEEQQGILVFAEQNDLPVAEREHITIEIVVAAAVRLVQVVADQLDDDPVVLRGKRLGRNREAGGPFRDPSEDLERFGLVEDRFRPAQVFSRQQLGMRRLFSTTLQ
jgi:hypothetical protein